MADYCRVYGAIHFTSPAGSAPGPTLGNEYGKTLPFTLSLNFSEKASFKLIVNTDKNTEAIMHLMQSIDVSGH